MKVALTGFVRAILAGRNAMGTINAHILNIVSMVRVKINFLGGGGICMKRLVMVFMFCSFALPALAQEVIDAKVFPSGDTLVVLNVHSLCIASTDCTPGESCVHGVCRYGGGVGSCVGDVDCPVGEVCRNNTCR